MKAALRLTCWAAAVSAAVCQNGESAYAARIWQSQHQTPPATRRTLAWLANESPGDCSGHPASLQLSPPRLTECVCAAVGIALSSLYYKQLLFTYPGTTFQTGQCSEYARQLQLSLDTLSTPYTTVGNTTSTVAFSTVSQQGAGLGPDSGQSDTCS